MKYLILLRGVNVGGKASVSMGTLQSVLQKAGFTDVKTYLNSGNVILQSDKDTSTVTKEVEDILKHTFFPIDILVLSQKEFLEIVQNFPSSWKNEDLRKYIAFLKSPATVEEFIQQVQPKDGIDFVDKGPAVVYLSTKMEGITKSGFPKLITKPIYKLMTMRNSNTVEKLLTFMQ